MTADTFISFAKNHFVELTAGYLTWNAISGSMPPAGPDSSVAYKWFYGAMHILALNLRNVVAIWHPKTMNIPGYQKDESSDPAIMPDT